MKQVNRTVLTALLFIATAACSETGPSGPVDVADDLVAGMVVSNAQAKMVNSVAALSVAGNAAFVSAAPGTFPDAFAATLANRTRGSAPVAFPIVDGGFDPVGVEAAADDDLVLTLSFVGLPPTSMTVKVPRRRPPVVVRTNPRKGRTDVALNVNVTIIFSEPVDPATVTPSTISLTLDGSAVSGTVRVSADGLTAEFIPESQLLAERTYSVVVSQGITDLEGDALSEAVTTNFTTARIGSIVVTTTTTFSDESLADPDGYTVSMDDGPVHAVDINGSSSFLNVASGTHDVRIDGVSESCAVTGSATVQATVLAGIASSVRFVIHCGPVADLTGMIAFVSERDGNSEIYRIGSDGTGLTRLTDNPAIDSDPAWSPDGARILFASNRGSPATDGSDIYVMNADGSNVSRLTNDGQSRAPAWSPDGNTIAFSSVRDGQFGIYVMRLGDPANATNIAHSAGYQTDPAWSPDGTRIAFTSDWRAYDFVFDLYVAKIDGSGITPLLTGPFFWADGWRFFFQAAWSPDGHRIAVVTCEYAWDNCYPSSTIDIADADGLNRRTLVSAGGFSSPTWSPDGANIAYSVKTCRDCPGTLRYVTADGTRSGTIFSNGHSPSWRP